MGGLRVRRLLRRASVRGAGLSLLRREVTGPQLGVRRRQRGGCTEHPAVRRSHLFVFVIVLFVTARIGEQGSISPPAAATACERSRRQRPEASAHNCTSKPSGWLIRGRGSAAPLGRDLMLTDHLWRLSRTM